MLGAELSRASTREEPTTLIMFDLDNFKRYNDTRGHIAGDDLLQRLGKHIKEVLPTGIPCRYCGEEFAILLLRTPQGIGKDSAEHLRASVEKEFVGETTLSVGIITSLTSSLPGITMLKEADKALYEAKDKGKNRVIQYVAVNNSLIINTAKF